MARCGCQTIVASSTKSAKHYIKCEPAVTVAFIELLAENKACPEDTLELLLEAPRMRQHLSTLGMKLLGSPAATGRRGA
jgi:hypothetical protein